MADLPKLSGIKLAHAHYTTKASHVGNIILKP